MPSRFTASLFGLAAALLVSMTPPALADSRPLRGDLLYTPPPPNPLTITQFVDSNSAELLLGQFAAAGYDLAAVRGGLSTVPRLYASVLPKDLRRLEAADSRKEAFIGAMLPLVLMANEEILQYRQRVERLADKVDAGELLNAEELTWLRSVAALYETDPWDFEELLLRVDALPVALTLAQAIEESGWGTSRYARDGNALFGQRTWSAGPGMTARKDGKALDHRARAFADLMHSVRAYMHNLNTHPAYKKFRAERQRQRDAGQLLDGGVLAGFLGRYAENEAYAENLRRLIRHNDLDRYESARLASGAVAERVTVLAKRGG
ncbi:MAG TPA: glucosaminidase domain-containing protein [Kiloniellales bacterium]|nr:glucosaminidase domain-containing protein [Kiloniellales bacterium]